MVGVQGNGLCFACSHTWDPKEVTALPLDTEPPTAPVIDEVAVSTVAAALDVPDPYAFPATWDGLQLFRAAGGSMREETWWEVMMRADVESVDPKAAVLAGGARLAGSQGPDFDEDPATGDMRRVDPVTGEWVDTEHPQPSMMDGVDDAIAVTMMLAELIVKAGIAALNGQGDDVTPGVPPTGYLPDDPAMHGMIEQAAAIAVGMLITNMHLDVDELLATLGGVTYEETEGDQTTEASDDASTGNDE